MVSVFVIINFVFLALIYVNMLIFLAWNFKHDNLLKQVEKKKEDLSNLQDKYSALKFDLSELQKDIDYLSRKKRF